MELKDRLGFSVCLTQPHLAQNLYDFPFGTTPGDGHMFVQHPTKSNTYVTMDNYNLTLAKEKKNALLELAQALGAALCRL